MQTPAIENGKFGYADEKKFTPLGTAAYLIDIESNIDTNEIILSLATNYLGQTKVVKVPRTDLCSKTKLLHFAGQGLDITDSTVSCFTATIKQQEALFDSKKIQFVHSSLGWNDKPILKADFKKYCCRINGLKSTYVGSFDIKPRGKKKIWFDMVNDYVLSSPALTFALVVGLSAVLNGLNSGFCGGETPLVHFVGGSSTGKTTAAMLAISAGGNPAITMNGLFRSWGATKNALISSLVDNFGMPIAFDEASMFPGKDFSSFIYTMTSGREKDRLTKELNLRETKGYRTVILSTGEKSILSNCNSNNGIKVRVLEINGITFTDNAASADHIKEICRHNYGWGISEFVKEICKSRRAKSEIPFDVYIEQIFSTYKIEFLNSCVRNAFTERMVNKYALFMLTAELAKSYLCINIDMKALFEFIVQVDYQNNILHSRDIATEFLEKLVNHVFSRRHLYIYDRDSEIHSYTVGKIIREKASKKIAEVIITADNFRPLITEFGFEDSLVVLNELKKSNCLRHDKDRNDTKRTLVKGSNAMRCYDIIIPERMLEDASEDVAENNRCNNTDTYDDYDNI